MYNKAVLIGRLTADPEMKVTPNGISVCTFTVACDRRGKEKKADFLNVVVWRQAAEFVSKYFSKGKSIGVEGSIQTRDFVDKNSVKRYVTEIVADSVFFVGDKGQAQPTENATQGYSGGVDVGFEEIETDSDLPF